MHERPALWLMNGIQWKIMEERGVGGPSDAKESGVGVVSRGKDQFIL